MGEDDEPGLPEASPSRARRAQLVSAVSLAVVAIACLAYLRPALDQTGATASLPAKPVAQLDAVDFISPTTGWVLQDRDDFQFAVLQTTDAGRHWKPELLEPSVTQGEYMRFFDAQHGIVATIGGEALVYVTDDGGAHWRRHIVYDPYTFSTSASFSDPLHGWELIGAGEGVPLTSPALVRTSDGGSTWTRLGGSVAADAEPFAVTFTDATHGWLDAVSHQPVAYATADGGSSWTAMTLPNPAGGWPAPGGAYFVAVRPTLNNGLIASVVNSAHINGRTGIDVLAYPPLTVKTFDGGAPVIYEYGTFADSPTSAVAISNRPGQLQAANQTVMRSVDGGASWTIVAPPSNGGTLGFVGPLDWWWVGPSSMATTHDGGLTWSAVRSVGVASPVPGSLLLLDSQHAWITAMVRGAAQLYSTSNGGGRWSPVSVPALSLSP